MREQSALNKLLDVAQNHGGLQTDDVLALVLPLLKEVAALHEKGQVAALDGQFSYQSNAHGFLELARPGGITPSYNEPAIERIQARVSSMLHVVGETRLTVEAESGIEVENLDILDEETPKEITRPVYLPGYAAWDHRVGQRDALADILCLGQVLASLACGVDLNNKDDLQLFVGNRGNLFRLHERLHPVIAGVIVEMTELNRHQRARDLPSLIRRLETYRDQPLDLAMDRVVSSQDSASKRRSAVQVHLRDRLFDLSRRNRLLHFRPTHSNVNLTVASVPLVVDLKSIQVDQLCVWNGLFAHEVLSGDRLPLSRWLRFEDQPYLPGSLDRIIQESRRDRAEYGFSQLSLVLCFLRWHNLKEARDERIASPLLLLPIELTRKKGVRDQYVLQADTTEAEVNPVLRQHLRQLYGIELPDKIDLRTVSIAQFHQSFQQQIIATEPGVQLRLIEQPEIELIHQRAKQKLEQFRRRQRVRPPTNASVSLGDYSYSADDFRPLGLKLFHERVLPSALPLRGAVGGRPEVRHPQIVGNEIQNTTFAMHERQGNPYQWDFDLTAVTLGNFNYRKMSLVRDYSAIIDDDMVNPAFDRIFSLQPRSIDVDPPQPLPLADQWTVVQADATQISAVALARTGVSYIIQGPPGTGKSQTITNLIADYIGRGKRVLFVCEKRAAIDVVFHRLRQQGMDELCCMIHDSQADKKSFVLNLKQTYEHWLASEDALDFAVRERQGLVKGIEQDVLALQRFDAVMRTVPEHVGFPVRELVHRLVALRGNESNLTNQQIEALPSYDIWRRHGDLAEKLQRALLESTGVASLAQHVFARLPDALIRDDRPLARLSNLSDQSEKILDQCSELLAEILPAESGQVSLADLLMVIDHSVRLVTVAKLGHLSLLDRKSELFQQLESMVGKLASRANELSKAAEQTIFWTNKLSPADAKIVLTQLAALEKSPLRWLNPAWWRITNTLKRCYNFKNHPVRPLQSHIVSNLIAEQEAESALNAVRVSINSQFGCENPDTFVQTLRAISDSAKNKVALSAYHQHLLNSSEALASVMRLAELREDGTTLAHLVAELVRNATHMTLSELGEIIRDLRESADSLPDLLPLLLELSEADPDFAQALRIFPLAPRTLEYAIAHESLERIYRQERWLPRFDGATLARHVERLTAAERSLLTHNAQTVRASVRRKFRDNIQRSTLAASQLDTEGKLFKKAYSAGRRELEHEFGKSMRYKSIRELASADSGRVVRDMKPIWLMSPLSVSDTLPLAPDLFDVVIFDEASQIPMEEAVPALYRAPQVIVVGDEMQLPPTSFFSSIRGNDDDSLSVDEEGERFAVVLDADSLLNQGARNLSATLLAWHYRSRYESLVGFSNAAFYAGNLYTIPDRSLPLSNRADINIRINESSETTTYSTQSEVLLNTDALLARAISFHSVIDAVYKERCNENEAKYIALLVRELLARETGLSIGIVAFSEAQQSEIESALDTLANSDNVFAARLEAEYVREEDDQFCGLIVKNLENVQGDERDIIILSICYGRGPDGRMLMNFGPINQRGGEKRLNVIFSRARQHMAVISSIRHDAITNDYNEGASALKQFLRYAECSSRGDRETAQRVLENLNPTTRKALGDDGVRDEVALQLSMALRERGFTVDEKVGQSRFRCDLGIRDARAESYSLGILIDTPAHYLNRDVFERFVSRPRILSAFGWKTIHVLTRDWFHNRESVLEHIERALLAKIEPRENNRTENLANVDDTLVTESQSFESELSDIEVVAIAEPLNENTPTIAQARRFEFIEGASRKFWQIDRHENEITVTFGRIGTKGQTQLKQFSNEERAVQEVDKLVAEKIKKGYIEIL